MYCFFALFSRLFLPRFLFSSSLINLTLAFQQLFALKGSQYPQCLAVLEAVAEPNHVLEGLALELLPTLIAQLQNVSHVVGELVLLLLSEQGFQLIRSWSSIPECQ